MDITIYTRQGCHLCEAAEQVVRATAPPQATIRLVDIDADPVLTDRYTVRVPVVEVDGVEVAEYEVDAAALRSILAAEAPVDDTPRVPSPHGVRAWRRRRR